MGRYVVTVIGKDGMPQELFAEDKPAKSIPVPVPAPTPDPDPDFDPLALILGR